MLVIDSGGTNAQRYGWRAEKPEIVIFSSAETIRTHVQCQRWRWRVLHYHLLYLLVDANGWTIPTRPCLARQWTSATFVPVSIERATYCEGAVSLKVRRRRALFCNLVLNPVGRS